jgi:hypothetical protein
MTPNEILNIDLPLQQLHWLASLNDKFDSLCKRDSVTHNRNYLSRIADAVARGIFTTEQYCNAGLTDDEISAVCARALLMINRTTNNLKELKELKTVRDIFLLWKKEIDECFPEPMRVEATDQLIESLAISPLWTEKHNHVLSIKGRSEMEPALREIERQTSDELHTLLASANEPPA